MTEATWTNDGTNNAVDPTEKLSPELQAKMDEELHLQRMQSILNRRQGVSIGGLNAAQMHYDPAADIRSRAFASAMQVHAHRTTNHHEILECARAFEDYLKGHPEYAEATLAA